MKVTILGYSGAYPTEKSGTSAYLVESQDFQLAIDMGSGGFLALKEKMDPLDLDALVITHYHGDHIADVNVLQYYRQLNQATPNILPIYGNDEDVCHFKTLTIPNVSEGIRYQEGDTLEVGPFRLSFLKTIHPVPTFAVRIEEMVTGKVLVFTADSGYMEELIPFSKDADLFLADTYFLTGEKANNFHLSAKETGEIALAANVSHIVATHLSDKVSTHRLRVQIEEASQYNIPVDIAEKDKVFEL